MQGYNPTVNDLSGQYLAAGITSATDAVAGGMSKADMDRKTLDMIMGKADQYRAAGLLDDKTYGDITRSSLSKATGVLAGFEATVVNPYLEQQKYQSYANAQMQIKGAGSGTTTADGFSY
jgi:hypothetical protein